MNKFKTKVMKNTITRFQCNKILTAYSMILTKPVISQTSNMLFFHKKPWKHKS